MIEMHENEVRDPTPPPKWGRYPEMYADAACAAYADYMCARHNIRGRIVEWAIVGEAA